MPVISSIFSDLSSSHNIYDQTFFSGVSCPYNWSWVFVRLLKVGSVAERCLFRGGSLEGAAPLGLLLQRYAPARCQNTHSKRQEEEVLYLVVEIRLKPSRRDRKDKLSLGVVQSCNRTLARRKSHICSLNCKSSRWYEYRCAMCAVCALRIARGMLSSAVVHGTAVHTERTLRERWPAPMELYLGQWLAAAADG
eukprot:IDg15604t1